MALQIALSFLAFLMGFMAGLSIAGWFTTRHRAAAAMSIAYFGGVIGIVLTGKGVAIAIAVIGVLVGVVLQRVGSKEDDAS